MDEMKNILNRIQKFRERLNKLVEHSNDRTNDEIVRTSKMLDKALNEYEIKTKENCE